VLQGKRAIFVPNRYFQAIRIVTLWGNVTSVTTIRMNASDLRGGMPRRWAMAAVLRGKAKLFPQAWSTSDGYFNPSLALRACRDFLAATFIASRET
jgi:hypothetical protein